MTVIAPDGYMKSLPVEYVDKLFPRAVVPLMLGYEKNGVPLGTSKLDAPEGRIVGEGRRRRSLALGGAPGESWDAGSWIEVLPLWLR